MKFFSRQSNTQEFLSKAKLPKVNKDAPQRPEDVASYREAMAREAKLSTELRELAGRLDAARQELADIEGSEVSTYLATGELDGRAKELKAEIEALTKRRQVMAAAQEQLRQQVKQQRELATLAVLQSFEGRRREIEHNIVVAANQLLDHAEEMAELERLVRLQGADPAAGAWFAKTLPRDLEHSLHIWLSTKGNRTSNVGRFRKKNKSTEVSK